MSDDYSKYTAERADEELLEGAPSPLTFGLDPIDQMPVPVTPDNHDIPPPLSIDTLICMADTREFVLRDPISGEILYRFQPSEVTVTPSGVFIVPEARVDKSKMYYAPTRVIYQDDNFVQVEPIRPACEHYFRIQTDTTADRTRRYIGRSCQLQKTEGGEYYSLRDSLVLACSGREPRHVESEISVLDATDQRMLDQASERKQMAEDFDIDSELEKEQKSLGILGSS